MRLIKTLRRLVRIWKKKPCIDIYEYGNMTLSNHRVGVGIKSNTGSMGLGLDFPADETGHARAEMHAKTLHRITGLPVIDYRDPSVARVLEGTD